MNSFHIWNYCLFTAIRIMQRIIIYCVVFSLFEKHVHISNYCLIHTLVYLMNGIKLVVITTIRKKMKVDF